MQRLPLTKVRVQFKNIVFRTYLYKLVMVKGGDRGFQTSPMNLFYSDRAWVIPRDGVDLDLLNECAQLFVGKNYLKNFVRVNTREVCRTAIS